MQLLKVGFIQVINTGYGHSVPSMNLAANWLKISGLIDHCLKKES